MSWWFLKLSPVVVTGRGVTLRIASHQHGQAMPTAWFTHLKVTEVMGTTVIMGTQPSAHLCWAITALERWCVAEVRWSQTARRDADAQDTVASQATAASPTSAATSPWRRWRAPRSADPLPQASTWQEVWIQKASHRSAIGDIPHTTPCNTVSDCLLLLTHVLLQCSAFKANRSVL